MPDIVSLYLELQAREKQINDKLVRIIEGNPNPFPHEKINKAHQLLSLITQAKAQIDKDDLDGLKSTIGELIKLKLPIKSKWE